MKEKEPNKYYNGGISSNLFAFLLLGITIIMHIIIVLLVINVNRASNELFALMERSGVYQLDATNMQASNTVMSETCSSYIQTPLDKDGSPNVGPLFTYAKEISAERRAPKVVERFKDYEVSDDIRSYIEKAAELSQQAMDAQLHSISLMASVYPLPPAPELSEMPLVPLTPAEEAMSKEEREAYARQLVTEKDYVQLRYYINENVTNCNRGLQQEFTYISEATKRHVAELRTILWLAILAIIFILSCAFIFFYTSIVKPLNEYSADISANRCIRRESGILEMRQLAGAFNKLLSTRNKLESALRVAAEKDSLTGLPNRYCMQCDIMKNEKNGGSMAVLLFDVNFLKKVNDTEGHLAGDNLIRSTAFCIRECFGLENIDNCYRIGGDEFMALLSGCDESDVRTRINRFGKMTKEKKLTVSVGYAYTSNSGINNFEELMKEADRNMYEHKRRVHEVYDTARSDAD